MESEELVLITQKLFPKIIFLTLFEEMSTDITNFGVFGARLSACKREGEIFLFIGLQTVTARLKCSVRSGNLQEMHFINEYIDAVDISGWQDAYGSKLQKGCPRVRTRLIR